MTHLDQPGRSPRRLLRPLFAAIDILLLPLVYPSAWVLERVRRLRVRRLPRCRSALLNVGVFPLRDHYYEPRFDHRHPRRPYSEDRLLPGIDWNVEGQLAMLEAFRFADELAGLDRDAAGDGEFHLDNGNFGPGDAEYWYQVIRTVKPRRIVEVGSGHSTLMARRAIRRNREEDGGYTCEHVCVEPFEMPWLEATGVTVVRQPVEDLDVAFFADLQRNDILFIDSSHVIRPQGDVLFAYLELLPTLSPGVLVHAHDIFSPKDYPAEWLEIDVKFWNEQYLLEAFLSHNGEWEIVGALNYLRHHHFDRLRTAAPFLREDSEPASLYMRKRG